MVGKPQEQQLGDLAYIVSIERMLVLTPSILPIES